MATYAIDMAIPHANLEEFIEALRGIGAVETVQFTVEAKTRSEALWETLAVLDDFSATHRGEYLSPNQRESIAAGLRKDPKHTATTI